MFPPPWKKIINQTQAGVMRHDARQSHFKKQVTEAFTTRKRLSKASKPPEGLLC